MQKAAQRRAAPLSATGNRQPDSPKDPLPMGILLMNDLTPAAIRAHRADAPKTRARDLARQLGLREAELVAAHLGHGATRIVADPRRLMPAVATLGDVMGLTRNESAVLEKTGTYDDYQGGKHAGVVIRGEIDMRVFPSHWVHAFAVEEGDRRSIQVFDGAGDAVHKIYLREASHAGAWAPLVAELREDAPQDAPLTLRPRRAPAGAKGDPARRADLRRDWQAMTDTHQFYQMAAALEMNRLGAYRIAGPDLARPLAPTCIPALLEAVAAGGFPFMIFVGNPGMIEIHTGPIRKVVAMGPWINILDPGTSLHLRADQVAEVYAVDKPTEAGMARSVECFDAAGELIAQFFGVLKEGPAATEPWAATIDALPQAECEGVA